MKKEASPSLIKMLFFVSYRVYYVLANSISGKATLEGKAWLTLPVILVHHQYIHFLREMINSQGRQLYGICTCIWIPCLF